MNYLMTASAGALAASPVELAGIASFGQQVPTTLESLVSSPYGLAGMGLLILLWWVKGWYSDKRTKETAAKTEQIRATADTEREKRQQEYIQSIADSYRLELAKVREEMALQRTQFEGDLHLQRAEFEKQIEDMKAGKSEQDRLVNTLQLNVSSLKDQLSIATRALDSERKARISEQRRMEETIINLEKQLAEAQAEARTEKARAEQLARQVVDLQAEIEAIKKRETAETPSIPTVLLNHERN